MCLISLHLFIKCGISYNQPQEAGIGKNEVEQTKNSLNKPKQLRTILKNYFQPNIRVNIFLLRLIVKNVNISKKKQN